MPVTSPQPMSAAGATRAGMNGTINNPAPALTPALTQAAAKGKKSKGKKADPSETEKLLAAKISQLELDQAGEKDQEQEIEREVRKATRDLNNLLAGMGTPLERMEALQKRIADLMGEMKRVEKEHIKGKKRADQLQKERDAQRVELTKTTSMKDKLEKLAREFTKENKKLKEDLQRLQENERRTRESTNLQDSLLLANHDAFMGSSRKTEPSISNAQLDELFRTKFKSFFEQYNLRELHFLSALRAKDCEIQHYLLRLENQKKMMDSETTKARQLSSQVSTFSQTETELRSQLNIYVEKFRQVEDTLNNSNDLFLTFRKEMEEMSKKTKRLEKDNLTLTRKHELTNRNVLEMVDERARMAKELEAARRKIVTLESIIRQMQEQGRDPGAAMMAAAAAAEGTLDEVDDDDEEDADGTESEYDSEVEYDDDDNDERAVQPPPTHVPVRRASFGDGPLYHDDTEDEMPPPPPPPNNGNQKAQTSSKQGGGSRKTNGRTHTLVNGGGRGGRGSAPKRVQV